MNRSWARSLGKFLLWLGGGLFAITLLNFVSVAPGTVIANLRASQELLALLFLISVILGTALLVTDIELGGDDER